MPKKEIRIVTASEDVAAIIDRGAEVKTQLDNLTYEDKGLKVKIGQLAQDAFDPEVGETSIRLEGNSAIATVSESERLTINAGAETFPKLKEAVEAGLLNVVTVKKELKVPPADIARAAEVLEQAGIKASVVESLNITADDVRTMGQPANQEELEARHALMGCIESSKSYRVKYDKK